jgi:hypothetical protein
MFIDEITLNASHSLILGNKPEKLGLGQIHEKLLKEVQNQDLTSLGLFDSAQPNYTTYYPDVSEEDLNPKDSDFIHPVFRMLSETVVHGIVSFKKPGVLKNSMSKLVGQTIYVGHEMLIGNAIGSVESVSWQEGYKDKSGIQVPAGINAVMKIDGKSNPRLARGIMMNPPSINSNSVTVRFTWEQSHKEMEEDEFYQKLGQFDENGNQILKVATDIVAYMETSLVPHGADYFAKKVDENGKLILPGNAAMSKVYSLSFKEPNKNLTFDNIISNQAIPFTINNANNNNKPNLESMEFLLKLAQRLNINTEGLNEEVVLNHLQSLNIDTLQNDLTAANQKVTELNNSISTLTQEKEELQNTLNSQKDLVELGQASKSKVFQELETVYNSLKGDKADSSFSATFKDLDVKVAETLMNDYKEQLEAQHPLTCGDCKSQNVSRASSTVENGDSGKKDSGNTTKTNDEVKNDFREGRKNASLFLSKFKSDNK